MTIVNHIHPDLAGDLEGMKPHITMLDTSRRGPDLLQRLDDCIARLQSMGEAPKCITVNQDTHDMLLAMLGLDPRAILGQLRMLRVYVEPQVPPDAMFISSRPLKPYTSPG